MKVSKNLCIGENESHLNLNNNTKKESCEHYRYLGVGRDSQKVKNRICQEKKGSKTINLVE